MEITKQEKIDKIRKVQSEQVSNIIYELERKQEIRKNEVALKEKDKKIKELEEKNGILNTEINKLKEGNKFKVSLNDYNQIKQIVENLQKENQDLKENYKKLEKQKDRAIMMAQSQSNASEDASAKEHEWQKANEDINAKLKQEDEENKKLSVQLNMCRSQYNVKLKEKEDEINKLKLQLDEYNNALIERDRIIEEKYKEIDKQNQVIAEKDNRISKLTSDIAAAKEYKRLDGKIDNVMREYNELLKEYVRLADPLEALKKFIEKFGLKKCNVVGVSGAEKKIQIKDGKSGTFFIGTLDNDKKILIPKPEIIYGGIWQRSMFGIYNINIDSNKTSNIIEITKATILDDDKCILFKGEIILK